MARSRGRKRIVRWQDDPVWLPQTAVAAGVYGAAVANQVIWTAADQANVLNRATILRIVGQLTVVNSDGANSWHYTVGIKKVIFSDAGLSQDATTLNASSSGGDPWMFIQSGYLQPHLVTEANLGWSNQYRVPFGDFVDIRTKRALRHNEGIAIFLQAGAVAVQMFPTLRVLYALGN